MKYVDNRGTIFSISMSGLTGHVENGSWDFEVVQNNIKTTGELKVKHFRREYDEKRVSFTFKGVKELKNDFKMD